MMTVKTTKLPATATVESLEPRQFLSADATVLIGPALHPTTAAVQVSSLHSRAKAPKPALTVADGAPSPLPLFESAAETVNGKVYVFGGFIDTDVQATSQSDVYNPRTNTWTQIADMPEPLTHTGNIVIGHKIWFVGGFVGDEGNVLSPSTMHVWIYDVKTNIWAAGPDLPAARGAGAVAKVGNTLHFFGGLETRAQDQGEHWALNLKRPSDGWAAKAALPVACNHLAGATIKGKVFAIGGQHLWDEDNGNVDSVQVYDPKADAWTMAAPLPTGRGHIADSTFVFKGRIVSIGGAADGTPALTDIVDYNPSTNAWALLGNIPLGRRAPIATAVGNKFIISGGDPGDVSATTQTWIATYHHW